MRLVRLGGIFYIISRFSELIVPIIGNLALLPILSGFIGTFKCLKGDGEKLS